MVCCWFQEQDAFLAQAARDLGLDDPAEGREASGKRAQDRYYFFPIDITY